MIVISNRLPVRRDAAGQWISSSGGLVSAIAPVLRQRDGGWVGWSGIPDDGPFDFEHEGIALRAVRLSQDEVNDYYYGFCNGTIWPLFHDALRTPEYHRHWWRPYHDVNQRFAEAASGLLRSGDVAWVHDYQLNLVPGQLRALRPDVAIGFYLHIPFPPVDLFGQLPWRRQMLEGMLGADVLGFQTRRARNNFAAAARLYTSAEGSNVSLRWQNRTILLVEAPIAIDYKFIAELAQVPDVVNRSKRLREIFSRNAAIILGVDRLDYTKGIDIRLRAFATLLERYPQIAERCVLVQVAVPTREQVGDYERIRGRIERLVGQINGRFARLGRVPVHYLYRSLPIDELMSYYLAADVMMVTPLRDGMNMVALEYCAARKSNTGVLVLSEFAGAANYLPDALLVNPHDIDGLADAMYRAVSLGEDEQIRRMRRMRRRVRTKDVFAWARLNLDIIAEHTAG